VYASCGRDAQTRFWAIADGRATRTIEGGGRVFPIDGGWAIVNRGAAVLHRGGAHEVRPWPNGQPQPDSGSATVDPDGRWIAACANGDLGMLCSLDDGRLVSRRWGRRRRTAPTRRRRRERTNHAG